MNKSICSILLILAFLCPAINAQTPISDEINLVQKCEYLILYHGSPYDFERVMPRYSMRSQDNVIAWEGEAIFATNDYRIALFYTQNKTPGFSAGIDLISPISANKRISFNLFGGNSLEEALEALYGNRSAPETTKGYIYLLNGSFFHWEKGLGTMEFISYDPNANIGKLCINRRDEIEKYVEMRLVELKWKKETPIRQHKL